MTERASGHVGIKSRHFSFSVHAGREGGFDWQVCEIAGQRFSVCGTCLDFLEAFECMMGELEKLREARDG